jgi:hypothetical protein
MCDCITRINDHINKQNSRLVLSFRMDEINTARVALQTEKINTRDRRSMGALATFCPFCGSKYGEPVQAEPSEAAPVVQPIRDEP